MARLRTLGLGLIFSIGLAVMSHGASARTLRSAQGSIVINEVQANPVASGTEADFEWVELYNPGPEGVALGGWRLSDARAMTTLPEVSIAAGGYMVVAGARFAERFPNAPGGRATVPRIGNGLGNSGDGLQLADAGGQVVDALSWGDNTSAFDPPAPAAPSGSSLERLPAGRDTNVAADWFVQATPSPGAPAGPGSPEATATTGAPPATARPDVRLNEVLAAPRDVDWDGDGAANGDDEWVEVVNVGTADLELRGWLLDDLADGGSSAYQIPDAVVIPARGHRVFFKRETGLALNNGGDSARLLQPDGQPVDSVDFGASASDASWSRDPDISGPWTDRLNPSPGDVNGAAGARPTSAATAPSATVPPSPPTPTTPVGPAGTAAPTATSRNVTPTATAGPTRGLTETLFLPFLISEVMFDPMMTGNDASAEWVEIHNLSASAASLDGWSIGDRSQWDTLPAVEVPPGGFAVIAGGAGVGEPGAALPGPRIVLGDGRIGGGLANDGDVVRLRSAMHRLADAVSYGNNLDAFDPSVPLGGAGVSIERLPSAVDSDTAGDWHVQAEPSPGRAGTVHDGPPSVTLNEVLPAPAWVDWDADGAIEHVDEWVELFNASPYPARLKGWRLSDAHGDGHGRSYRFDGNAVVPPNGFLVAYRSTTGIAMDNGADTLRLVRPDGTMADRFAWSASPGYDRSWGRTVDGQGEWSADLAVTPGLPNRPLGTGERHDGDVAHDQATAHRGRRSAEPGGPRGRGSEAPPRPATMADAHAMRRGTRVVLHGRVTAAPNVLATRTFYLGDETGGVRVYLNPTDGALKPFGLGEPVSVIGRLADYRGERQVVLARPEDAWWDGLGTAVPPWDVATGHVGEAVEGRLVRVRGRLVGAVTAGGVTLDDGSGPARVVVLGRTGILLPRWRRGQWVAVVGIAGQSAARAPWDGGYRVLPRQSDDLVAARGNADAVMRRTVAGTALTRRPHPVVRNRVWPTD